LVTAPSPVTVIPTTSVRLSRTLGVFVTLVSVSSGGTLSSEGLSVKNIQIVHAGEPLRHVSVRMGFAKSQGGSATRHVTAPG